MIDQLWKRLKGTQPWRVVLAEGVIDKALRDINQLYPAEGAKRLVIRRLDSLLAALEKDPLRVLGHPPLGTDDPAVFRYSADPQAALSAIADLDLQRRELVVVLIKVKGASRGSH